MQSELKALAASVSEYDAVQDRCPANKTNLAEKPCPVCGAKSNETCWPASNAAHDVASAARAALLALAEQEQTNDR